MDNDDFLVTVLTILFVIYIAISLFITLAVEGLS
mgnify:CR=1 FL=1